MKALKSPIIFILLYTLASTTQGSTRLQGTASYQELGQEIFLAALYRSQFSSPDTLLDLQQDLKMEVRATDNMTKRRWVNMWMQSIAINNPQAMFEAEAENLVNLFDAFKSGLKKGDIFLLSFSPETGASATFDGVELTAGQSWDFFRLFLQAWIGPVPPSSDFKSAILGEAVPADLAARLTTVTPSDERIQAVRAWLEPAEEKSASKPIQEIAIAPAPAVAVPEIAAPTAITTTEKIAAEKTAAPPTPTIAASQVAPIVEEETLPEEEVIISVESLLAQQEYTTAVIRKIYSSLSYPKTAVKRNMEGSVRVNVTILRDGTIQGSQLAQASEYVILNKAALKAVDNAAPFAPIPALIDDNQLEFSIPVVFKLTD